MIDPLFPSPRSIPEETAAYWPDTGFLELPDYPVPLAVVVALDEQGTGAEEWVSEYWPLVAHESTHWIQAHAFGYGRFQARIDRARTEIAESFWQLFTTDVAENLLTQRRAGTAVLQRTASGLPVPRPELGPIGMRLQRHWAALGLLRHALDTADCRFARGRDPCYWYGLAALYAAAGPRVSEVATLPDDALRTAAIAVAPRNGLERSVAAGGVTGFSSASVAECAAVLDQHWSYAHTAEGFRREGRTALGDRIWTRLVQSWESKAMTSYGDAFKVYQLLNPSLDLNAPRPLATLGVLCAVALDAPFPPEHQGRTRDWSHVVPSLRFIALARALSRVGLLPVESASALRGDEYAEYAARLCDAAGIPPPTRASTLVEPPDEAPSPVNDVRDLHHAAARAAGQLMQELPGAIVAPSETSVYRNSELHGERLASLRVALEAPLLVIGGEMSYMSIDLTQFTHCALGGTYQRLLWQLLGDVGPLRLDGLPRCERGQAMVETTLDLAERRLGTRIPFDR